MVRKRGTDPVLMACNHRFVFVKSKQPDSGVLIRCPACRGETYVPFPESEEWRFFCAEKKCRHGLRLCGKSYSKTVASASAHTRRWPQHPVWIVSPAGIVVERWFAVGQEGLFVV